MDKTRLKQVREEMKAVGASQTAILTPESKTIAQMLYPDEHIGGVVYGSYPGSLGWLVATNHRIIFIDKKPLFSSTDELSYDVVAGVQATRAGLSMSVVLHTRVRDYIIRYVPQRCADAFIRFIEDRALTRDQGESREPAVSEPRQTQQSQQTPQQPAAKQQPKQQAAPQPLTFEHIDKEAIDFLRTHDLAVLSTMDRTGNLHGAIVYYLIDQNNIIYILTQTGTGKGRNVSAHGQVALTLYEPGTLQTAQIQGIAEEETNQTVREAVFEQLVKPRAYRDGIQAPPVTKLHEGDYMIIKIHPTLASFHDYSKN